MPNVKPYTQIAELTADLTRARKEAKAAIDKRDELIDALIEALADKPLHRAERNRVVKAGKALGITFYDEDDQPIPLDLREAPEAGPVGLAGR